jgi:uncharacterized membrane protein (TIGR01666 family)
MEYQLEFKKFLSSQYLYTGLRITTGVLIPALVLYHFDLLTSMISIPLGALFVSLTDNPGPIRDRRNGMMVSIVLNVLVVLITGYSRVSHFMIGVEIIVFGIFFSLIAVYGNRANSIGLIALLVFILNIDSPAGNQPLWQQAFYFTIGGVWYAILSLTLYTLRPYRLIQQLLGECLMEIAAYLHAKALFYEKERDEDKIFNDLVENQVKIHHHLDELREILFSTRQFLSESTNKGRMLMMIFLDTNDLLERVMTSQQDYTLLHKEFDDSGILQEFKNNITILANALHHIGLAIQSGYSYHSIADLDGALQRSKDLFIQLRKEKMNADNIEGFIRLRHILYSLEDITERIKRIEGYSGYGKGVSKQYNKDLEPSEIISPEKLNIQLLVSNLSLKSANYRHALRLTIALLTGYIISLIFPLGHGYWILLTIVTIIRPAYSITRKRNIQRLSGTFIGAAIGFLLLYITKNETVLFITMFIVMLISYSFLRIQYMVTSAGFTIFVLLNFHFLNPTGLQHVLTDRIIDTIIGSGIAYLASYFVLPSWEYEQIDQLIKDTLNANREYFNKVANVFTGKHPDLNSLRLARKDAFVALANLSDNFQRMLSEPKSQQPHLKQYHQFVSTSHMLTSHIASLSYYAQRFGIKYAQEDFLPMIRQVDKRFEQAIAIMNNQGIQVEIDVDKLPINKKVQQLLEQRKKELNAGIESDLESVRRELSNLKTITEQFQLIHANLLDEIRILKQVKSNE